MALILKGDRHLPYGQHSSLMQVGFRYFHCNRLLGAGRGDEEQK